MQLNWHVITSDCREEIMATALKNTFHPERAIEYLDSNRDGFRKTLEDLSRIPSVSAEGYPTEEVARSAEATCAVMREIGLENVEVLTLPGVHPYAYGEWLRARGAPTVLLYGHHDVQPPGRPEKWRTPAFEPTLRQDGRLYGRGTVDDKAGVMVHLAAIDAYLKTHGELPVNVKFLVEGEEEIGSENLGAFLRKYRKRMKADFIVLTDTGNLETGLPSLTYQLRGIVAADLEVRALDHPLHSGMWGGPVPDPVIGISKILGGLVRDDGTIDIPGFYKDVRKTSARERARLRQLPFDEKKFRADGALVKGARLAGERDYSVYERLWTRPALTVIALEASPIKGSSNQIVDSARARVSVRIVPNQNPEDVLKRLIRRLTANPPWGLEVTAKSQGTVAWWTTNPEGPAFEAAARALEKGYGRKAAFIGAGGTIGFVEPFARELGGVPALLLGVEDPICNAHSENESLSLDDWYKGMKSAVYLYEELRRCPTK
jgi:acetylornithine deacetylase/succinyl-diaminopimelate desuccinylase-like protein